MVWLRNKIKDFLIWLKHNHLKLITAVGCIALGVIIGIVLVKGVPNKNEWLMGLITGGLTSLVVAIFLDASHKKNQTKRDVAIKKAVLFRFMHNLINQSMHMMCGEYPLYHHACDIDYMEEFVKGKIAPLNKECIEVTRYYSALMTTEEFNALNAITIQTKNLINLINSNLWKEMCAEKQDYHRFYNFLGHKDKAVETLTSDTYEKIKRNISETHRYLRSYLSDVETAVYIFSYLFDDDKSYKNLHADITRMNIDNNTLEL